jgi:hypothetical protein
LLKQDLTEGFH